MRAPLGSSTVSDVEPSRGGFVESAWERTQERLARYMPSRETRATLREVALMRHDLAPVVPTHGPGDDVVVLVHGIFASAGVWRPLRACLEVDAGARVASFSHAPGTTVRIIAKQLARLVSRIDRRANIHIVGHSLGGIVARWYVQELGGHERVTQTIALASPFGGSPAAKRFPLFVGSDLLPNSDVLRRIRARASIHDVPHLSIAGSEDRMVPPHASGLFPHGEFIELEGRGHNSLLYDEEVVRLVVSRVLSARRS